MNLIGCYAGLGQGLLHAVYHFLRPADESVVHLGGGYDFLQKLRGLRVVQAAEKQVAVALLAAQDVVHAQAIQKFILQALNGFLEDNRVAPAVAIHKVDVAIGFRKQHRFGNAQDGRDAAAGRKQHVALGIGGVQAGREPALGRHHV